MTACVRGAIFAGRPVFFLLFRFVGDKEDDAVVDDERLFLVFLLLIDGWDLELGGRYSGKCLCHHSKLPVTHLQGGRRSGRRRASFSCVTSLQGGRRRCLQIFF